MIEPRSVFLHDNRSSTGKSLLFAAPRDIVVAHRLAEVRPALQRLETAAAQGFWAAGYLAYEAGFAFEERLAPLARAENQPLLWFGLYDAPRELDRAGTTALLAEAGDGQAEDLRAAWDFERYQTAFDAVKQWIASGDVYQVNLTLQAQFKLVGDALGLYRRLAASQSAQWGAFVDTGAEKILSRSPELFVAGTGKTLTARPMKGTVRRGRLLADDAAGRAALQADEKNRAENLMIVDLLRNDLGRIAEIGSVKVTDLFTVETYRSLHTLTSGIVAERRAGVGFAEVIENLFPCGSITGAPKLRAMEIIHGVEGGDRGVYTGSIGYLAPSGDFAFNVAIRTAVIDADGNGTIGVGGGLVADSDAASEYQEALLKLSFLSDPAPPVTLIETLKWAPAEGFVLLERHLDRLVDSAAYFGLTVTRQEAADCLAAAAKDWTGPMRVRLTLTEAGLAVTAVPLPPSPEKFRFVVAAETMKSGSVWLAHKTTNRAFYDDARQAAHDGLGVDEVVFTNERGEVTEGSFTSLFVERDGVLLTPPLSSGLLPGTLRAELLATGRAKEQVLTLADLDGAGAIWLGNSVRGLIRAEQVNQED